MAIDPAPPVPIDEVDAVIFDLGGVILPLNYGATVDALSRLFSLDASQIYTQTKQNDLFERVERGEISPSEFRAELSKMCGKKKEPHSPEEAQAIDSAWSALLGSIPPSNLEFLRALKEKKRTFLLSNTNELHMRQFLLDYHRDHGQSEPAFESHFEGAHYSHIMGHRKPEAAIYQAILDEYDLDPARTLFLDDNEDNVRGAAAVGILALHHPTNLPLPLRFA